MLKLGQAIKTGDEEKRQNSQKVPETFFVSLVFGKTCVIFHQNVLFNRF